MHIIATITDSQLLVGLGEKLHKAQLGIEPFEFDPPLIFADWETPKTQTCVRSIMQYFVYNTTRFLSYCLPHLHHVKNNI